MSGRWTVIPDDSAIKATLEALTRRGINVVFVKNRIEAMAKLIELIPRGVEVMTGSSTTLEEIGFNNYLRSHVHGWRSLNEEIRKKTIVLNGRRSGEGPLPQSISLAVLMPSPEMVNL